MVSEGFFRVGDVLFCGYPLLLLGRSISFLLWSDQVTSNRDFQGSYALLFCLLSVLDVPLVGAFLVHLLENVDQSSVDSGVFLQDEAVKVVLILEVAFIK